LFAATTVFPEEMAELVRQTRDCAQGIADGSINVDSLEISPTGEVNGDTELPVQAGVVPIDFDCAP
jgi:hypothetical protein